MLAGSPSQVQAILYLSKMQIYMLYLRTIAQSHSFTCYSWWQLIVHAHCLKHIIHINKLTDGINTKHNVHTGIIHILCKASDLDWHCSPTVLFGIVSHFYS